MSIKRLADFPAYELYSDQIRAGVFPEDKERQLTITLGKDRGVVESKLI